MNDFLQNGLNTKIEQEKYALNIVIPLSQTEFEGDIKIRRVTKLSLPLPIPFPTCIRKKYNYYENYYFGKNVNQIMNVQETSALR